ncbi:MAG: type II toxin-antitoxin system VapC family toxin [Terriglobia bacterium]
MGQISLAVRDKVVAFDSAPLIYYLEDHPKFSNLAHEVFDSIHQGHTIGITSIVSLMEVLVLPLRRGHAELADQYRRLLLHTRAVTIAPVDLPVCEWAARLRAKHAWLRSPDALQFATAITNKADLVVTNDERWKRLMEIPVIVLSDFAETEP